jgi:hypothetical protein
MKAAFPLVLTALLGVGSRGAVAQIAPRDPAGNQTIPEKDLSRPAEGGTPNGNATSDGNQNLSDKLDKSGGVISQRKRWTRR